jgi:hypothetical protein
VLFYKGNNKLEDIINRVNEDNYISVYKNGSKIYIKKKNRGKFTESAKRAGMGV